MDFNFVDHRLATGAAIYSAADVQALVDAGVTHIIDCNSSFNDGELLASHPQITYLYNGTADDGQTKPPEWFQRSIEFALLALVAPKNRVYAHCAAGINRGPSTAYAILRAQGLSSLASEAIIRLARPQVGLRYKHDADDAIVVLGYE